MKVQKTIPFLLFFSLLLSVPTFSQIASSPPANTFGVSADRLARYDAYFQKEINEGRLPGIVTLVFKDGKKVHESALGFSDFTAKTPIRTDQIFFIQSMTKPIMSTAFMMLY